MKGPCVPDRTVVAARGLWRQRRQKNFFKTAPQHIYNQNDQPDVGITVSHCECWGRPPTPHTGPSGPRSLRVVGTVPVNRALEGDAGVSERGSNALPHAQIFLHPPFLSRTHPVRSWLLCTLQHAAPGNGTAAVLGQAWASDLKMSVSV